MSADNYHLIDRRADGQFVVLENLSASSDYTYRTLNALDPAFASVSLDAALRFAHKLHWTEYGVTLSERARADL